MTYQNAKSTLVLALNDENNENVILDAISEIPGVDARCIFSTARGVKRVLRRLSFDTGLLVSSIWFGGWSKEIEKYDTVICMASCFSPQILLWIRKHNSKARLINYYWDKIEVSGYPIQVHGSYENWSFDREDCNKHNLKFNHQFFIRSISDKIKSSTRTATYDVSFVGSDRAGVWKERSDELESCRILFAKHDISYSFYYRTRDRLANPEYSHRSAMAESAYFDLIADSRAVLDLVSPQLRWETLRPLQALTSGRKLITNNPDITREEYYTASNVFILGSDDCSKLKEFIETPFDRMDDNVFVQYEVTNWLEKFSNSRVPIA